MSWGKDQGQTANAVAPEDTPQNFCDKIWNWQAKLANDRRSLCQLQRHQPSVQEVWANSPETMLERRRHAWTPRCQHEHAISQHQSKWNFTSFWFQKLDILLLQEMCLDRESLNAIARMAKKCQMTFHAANPQIRSDGRCFWGACVFVEMAGTTCQAQLLYSP